MDTYEVAAIGDLYKKNVAGRKTWNLREFALTGVLMIYYKKGVKRGEWDISGCKVRKVSPEEAQQPAAKFAFAIEGNKKQYMLSANNEKNRELWITVLEKQIHEFRNPVRRFIRTGEIVHANGFVKKKNVFGKTPILLVITNFPRIIEIDPATIELKDQYSWVPAAPPTMTKLSDSRFKIMISGKELRFEDPANGMAYWEALFKRLHRIELWTPSKQPTLRIGFPTRTKGPKPEDKEKKEAKDASAPPETSKDLKFLEEALAHIQELLTTLNMKIDEIDMVFALAVQEGHTESSEEQQATAQERQLKRSQLVMLKENIDVIADNLKSLITRSKQTGSALFDVAAIESVISEAATLLVLLNSDDDDEEDEGAEVTNIDKMVAEAEEQVIVVEDKIATGEALAKPDIVAAVIVAKAEETKNTRGSVYATSHARGSVYKDPVTELDINPSSFDPSDTTKRPEGWNDILMRRVLKKEQADRSAGVSEDIILSERIAKEKAEDALMCEEVAKNGTVSGLKSGNRVRGATLQQNASALEFNVKNFDASMPTKRPAFWGEVRTKRVYLKEHIDRINGVPENILIEQRPVKEIEEEMQLVGEVFVFGKLLNVGDTRSIDAPSKIDCSGFTASGPRPALWDEVKLRRIAYKNLEDRLNGADEAEIASKQTKRANDEDLDMVDEALKGSVSILGDRTSHRPSIVIDTAAIAEEVQHVSEVPAPVAAPVEFEELVQYTDQTITFGSHIPAAKEPEPAPSSAAAAAAKPQKESMGITGKDVNNISSRPGGWADIKLRRVYLKEWEDRKNGVDEDEILEKRYQRELEAEQEMIAELGVRGKIAMFNKGISRPVAPIARIKARQDFASFMNQTGSIFDRMKTNMSKLEIN